MRHIRTTAKGTGSNNHGINIFTAWLLSHINTLPLARFDMHVHKILEIDLHNIGDRLGILTCTVIDMDTQQMCQ